MAVDPHAPPGPENPVAASPIENELPSYRAISPMAVSSLLLGLLSVFTFISSWFLVAGILAILTGALAQRTIRRLPDALTGGGLARAGIVLGLLFSLSAVTFQVVQGIKLDRAASQFASEYTKILASRDLADAYWLRLAPAFREGRTPESALKELTSSQDPANSLHVETQLGPLRSLQSVLGQPGASIRFLEIEKSGFDRLTPYAFAVLEVQPGTPVNDDHAHDDHDHAHDDHDHAHDDHDHAHDDHDHAHDDHAHDAPLNFELPAGPIHALLELRSDPDARAYDWYVQEILFPYNRKSHTLKAAPIDDGHGHAH